MKGRRALRRAARAAGKLGGVAGLFSLVACTSPEQQLADFRAFCAENAGVWIYRTVEGVDGFYAASDNGCGASCKDGLLREGFSFVEVEVPRTPKYTAIRYSLKYVPGPGLYRFSIAKAGDPNCFGTQVANRSDTENYNKYVLGRQTGNLEPAGDICIAAWPIQEISTRYEVREGISGRPAKHRPTANQYEWVVADRASGERLALRRNFYEGISRPFPSEDKQHSCLGAGNSLRARKVLLPSD